MAGTDLYLVFSNPVEGREDEYNEWYDEVHVADVLRIPGFVAAARYEYSATRFGDVTPPPTPHRYLAVYEISGDADEAVGELLRRAGGPLLPLSEALDVPNVTTSVWRRRAV